MNWLKNRRLILKFIHNTNSVKLKLRDQISLFSSIGDFLKNGFTLNEALSFYYTMHPTLRQSILILKRRLSQGNGLADGIKDLVDSKIYYQLKISEFHGNLIGALNDVGQFLKIKLTQRNKLISLLMYPIFLLILLFGIMIGIRILVTPQLQSYQSGSSRRYSWWLMTGALPIIVAGYGVWKYCRERSSIWRLNVLVQIPLIGGVYRDYYAYYFSSNLALMMNCGMDLQQIVVFMARFKNDSLIINLSRDVKRLAGRGREMKQITRRYHFIPKEMLALLSCGDTTDVSAQKLKAYSKLRFKAMVKRSSRLISLLQPIMFLIIGLIITGTYLSMLLPMYSSIKGVY